MVEFFTVWVCEDCLLHHANGECDTCFSEGGHGDSRPLSLLSDRATLGMAREEHSEDCLFHTMGSDVPGDYECDCEQTIFSKSPCEGCGSFLYGARYAMTEWSE